MPAPNATQDIQQAPLKIVGGTHFGRYDKISVEQTWNMIISDDALVPYAGYKNVKTLNPEFEGRGLYTSYRSNKMYAVIGTIFYEISTNLSAINRGTLATAQGDVYISENNNGEIAITDNQYIYVYKYTDNSFKSSALDPLNPNYISWPLPANPPGYISFQDGRFIVAANGSTNWILSGFNNGTSYTANAQSVGSLQTKPDYIQAVVPVPGGGNNILVFGRNVAEMWQDVGGAKFPYQRNSTFNSDYGCISPASIASLNQFVVWIAVNEQSGPVVMYTEGNQIKSISTEGIDYKLGNLSDPTNCTGFLFQQDGHIIYQFTFITDNLSYAYDFRTGEFFNISDPQLNYHIARQVVYFNNTYYFVSLNGGNIYEFDTSYPDAEYAPDDIQQIPRIRITPPFRLPTQRYFIIKSVGFTLEQGQPNNLLDISAIQTVGTDITTESSLEITTEDGILIATEDDLTPTEVATYVESKASVFLSTSRDGGYTFGSSWEHPMNRTGHRKSRFIWQRIGQANDMTFQFRFIGFIRFVVFDGVIEWYQ